MLSFVFCLASGFGHVFPDFVPPIHLTFHIIYTSVAFAALSATFSICFRRKSFKFRAIRVGGW